ncbi:helix-turn-helix domain-containing protein [Desulfurispirillum indicum]|uniref:Helix-turn-helix domain protein n=1 Tax=Desulfurispirillum indicum (strain ATCC BAA-1389 / DSM 22839 / S5) TaxID=653733 RepID=E6W743_DESIS|nr:helix-turn-helix transcriptional regulator [Desulfurispirillum indicum]ADU65121.1 helix-turn-helix domain protein [Desulfurispirillum indicum S5]UCZ57023.1 helix-turn-helix domain-containing protein [Desulfurispirillum indicum]
MSKILEQLRQRRKELGLTQAQMMLRVGMSRQQYQRLESKGNPRLDNLELLAKGLKLELMLIPQEKLSAVKALLEGGAEPGDSPSAQAEVSGGENPWKGLLEDEE